MSTNEEGQNLEGGNPEDKLYLTPLQIFALSYLYSEELKQKQKGQFLDSHRLVTHHSHSSVIPRSISIRVRELITILPFSMIPEMPTVEEVCNQLNILEEYGLLTQEHRHQTGVYASFSITGDGILLAVKRYFANLSSAIKDKKLTSKI